jgi:hypothetical protein
MNLQDVRDIYKKIRKKYPPSELSPEQLFEIINILFEYTKEKNGQE